MSTIQQDFDRIALVSEDGATHNDHYHNFLLRHLPPHCHNTLEIGCGTGGFARALAKRSDHVLAYDLSPEMIRLARERSTQFPNIDFQLADICDQTLPDESFDCIASIATLHHLPYAEMLLKMKAALKPGGVLLILDLFEPARISDSPAAGLLDSPAASLWDSLAAGLSDSLLNFVAFPVSVALRFKHYGRLRRLRQSPEERAAWAAHEHHDLYPTMHAVRTLCASILPCAKIKQHLLWRYSIVWQKPI